MTKVLESLAATLITPLHRRLVAGRRARVLSRHLAALLPTVPLQGLDVGCGSGEVARNLGQLRADVTITGVDVVARPRAAIPVTLFDGERLPFESGSYDFTMLIDVLHHTEQPGQLLRECARVSRRFVVLKDHFCENPWDRVRLRAMDWIGNRGHGVRLPYGYLSREQWTKLYHALDLVPVERRDHLHLYPFPFSFVFDGSLHFFARVPVTGGPQA